MRKDPSDDSSVETPNPNPKSRQLARESEEPLGTILTTNQGVRTFTYTGKSPTAFTGVRRVFGGGGGTLTINTGATIQSPTATVVAHDVVINGVASGIRAAEWFTGTDPGTGNGTTVVPAPNGASNTNATISFPITGLTAGQTVHIRVRDRAGSWSAVGNVTM